MPHEAALGGRSLHSLLTSESHDLRASLTLARVAGIIDSADSQVDGASSSAAPFACVHTADVSPALLQTLLCQAPHGPAAAPLPAGAATDSAFTRALACASWPNQPAAPPTASAASTNRATRGMGTNDTTGGA